jgi:hypothetical protein
MIARQPLHSVSFSLIYRSHTRALLVSPNRRHIFVIAHGTVHSVQGISSRRVEEVCLFFAVVLFRLNTPFPLSPQKVWLATTGCRPPSLSSTRGEAGINFLTRKLPPPLHWDRRAIQPNHMKFRTCSALAPM